MQNRTQTHGATIATCMESVEVSVRREGRGAGSEKIANVVIKHERRRTVELTKDFLREKGITILLRSESSLLLYKAYVRSCP